MSCCCESPRSLSPAYDIMATVQKDMKYFVLVVSGEKGPINYAGSRTAWKRKTILEKYRDATSVSCDARCVTLYVNARGHADENNSAVFVVEEHGGSFAFDTLEPAALQSELGAWLVAAASGNRMCVVLSLADAVWFKQNNLLFTVENVILGNGVNVYGSIVLPVLSEDLCYPQLQAACESLNRVVASRVDERGALNYAIGGVTKLVSELRIDFDGRPVRYEPSVDVHAAGGCVNPLVDEATVQGLVDRGGIESKTCTVRNGYMVYDDVPCDDDPRIAEVVVKADRQGITDVFPFNVVPTVNKVSGIVSQIDQENMVGRVNSLLGQLETEHQRLLEFVSKFMNVSFGVALDNVMCDAILFIDFVRGLLAESWYQVISCVIRLGHRLGINNVVIMAFIKYMNGFSTPSQVRVGGNCDAAVPQGAMDSGSILVAFIGMLLLHQVPDAKMVRSVVDQARAFNVFVPADRKSVV